MWPKAGFPLLNLDGVLVVPSLDVPLLSISSLRRSGMDTIFRGNEVEFKLGNQACAKGVLGDKLYYLDRMIDRNFSVARLTHQIFHNRLGHPSDRKLKKYLALNPHVVVDAPNENFFCEPCIVGKFRRMPFNDSKQTHESLDVLSSDLCCPFRPQSMGGARYLQVF
jgi:hypothetical protein